MGAFDVLFAASDGVNYERRALCDWFKESNTSPATGSRLTNKRWQQRARAASFALAKKLLFFENSYVDNEALKEQIRLFIGRKKGSSASDAIPRLE
jgi:hypothetical protein